MVLPHPTFSLKSSLTPTHAFCLSLCLPRRCADVGRRGNRCCRGSISQPELPAHPHLQRQLGPRGRWEDGGWPCQACQRSVPAGGHRGESGTSVRSSRQVSDRLNVSQSLSALISTSASGTGLDVVSCRCHGLFKCVCLTRENWEESTLGGLENSFSVRNPSGLPM